MNDTVPLKLKLPERSPAPIDSILLDPRKVEQWVSALPIANTGESSKRVFKALVEFNRIDLKNIDRIKIINILRPLVQYIASNLKKYYLDSSLPLAAKNQQVVVLCRELHSELAISYKIIIEKMARGDGEKFESNLMVLALHQAIHYLTKTLYYSAVVYNPYPEGVWQEINHLYFFAELNNVSRIKINEDKKKRDSGSTIEEIYKKALLFAIASPYRLRQQEIENLYQNIPEWSEHITIFAPTSESRYEGHFYVRTDHDESPMHITLANGTLSKHCRLVDTRQLAHHLRIELKSIFTQKNQTALFTREMQVTVPMLRKIINSLTSAPKRNFIRTQLNFELETAVGINSIHSQITAYRIYQQGNQEGEEHLLNEDEEDLKDSSFLDSYFTADNDSLQIVPLDHPVDDAILDPKEVQDSWIVDDGAPAWASKANEGDSETFSCKTFNESAGGYCINWTGHNPPKIRVGELIGIQSASDRSQFSIGITRWLKHMQGVGLQLGMEIISPTAFAVNIQMPGDGVHGDTIHKCILIPEVIASNTPSSLITPVLNIHVGAKIKIDDDTSVRHAKLIRLLESTGTFNQFEFVYLNEDGEELT